MALTDTADSRPQPLKTLSIGDLSNLLIAYAAGEISEGFLMDITGLPGDAIRALWFDAIESARTISDSWISTQKPLSGGTSGQPVSSGNATSDHESNGPGMTA